MILDSGLDAACSTPFGKGFIQYAAFGTGSTEPAASQTTLDAQVGARTNSAGGFADIEDAGLDDTNDLIWYEITFTRVFDIASNVNATEWALSNLSTGNLCVRELFRADPNDNQSTPITLSLEAGDQLQLVITFRVQATWEYESKSFVITGTAGNDAAGTHTGNATVSTGTSTALVNIKQALSDVWPGGAGFDSNPGYLHAITSDQSTVAKNQNVSSSAVAVAMTMEAYTPGNFYRDHTGQFSTAQANTDHYAWAVVHQSFTGGAFVGYRYILTNPTKLTKASTHRLSLTIRKTIARL